MKSKLETKILILQSQNFNLQKQKVKSIVSPPSPNHHGSSLLKQMIRSHDKENVDWM